MLLSNDPEYPVGKSISSSRIFKKDSYDGSGNNNYPYISQGVSESGIQ